MNQHRYTLDKSSRKHVCPSCGKRRFVRYIDTTNGEYLPERFGRCDREAECRHHNRPYNGKADSDGQTSTMVLVQPPKVFIPDSVLDGTLRHYGKNTFTTNLTECIPYPFDQTEVQQVCDLYKIGTIREGYMAGATTFPYIDIDGNTRAIQVRMYDRNNHGTKTTFIHSLLKSHYDKLERDYPEWLTDYMKNDSVVSCLFGEHLLKEYPDRPVNIVEAPKTAIIATLYFGHPASDPNVPLWLASFNLSSLNFARCKVIRNRRVTLFPDLSTEGRAYKQWKAKASEFSELIPSSQWMVSRLLEDSATSADRAKGADLADFLVRLDWRKFNDRQDTMKPVDEAVAFEELMDYFEARRIEFSNKYARAREAGSTSQIPELPTTSLSIIDKVDHRKDCTDIEEIRDHETYFQTCNYPIEPLLMDGITVNDWMKFARAHISFLRASTRQVYRLPYLQRLRRLRAILEASDSHAKAV